MNHEKALELGERIKFDRKDHGLTQLELCNRSVNLHEDYPDKYAEISLSTIKNIEGARRENHTPRPKTLITIAKIFGYPEDTYLTSLKELSEEAITKKAKELLYERALEQTLDTPLDDVLNEILATDYSINIVPFIQHLRHLGYMFEYNVTDESVLESSKIGLIKYKSKNKPNSKYEKKYLDKIENIKKKLDECPAPASLDESNLEYDEYYELIAMLNETEEQYRDFLHGTSTNVSDAEIRYQAKSSCIDKLASHEDTPDSSPIIVRLTTDVLTDEGNITSKREFTLKAFLSFAQNIDSLIISFISI